MSIPIYCAHTRLIDPNTLKPNPANPNRHSAHQIALLASIIQEQGWRNSITLSKRSGMIVRGHGRLEAALLIGCESVPVDEQDYASEAEELADLLWVGDFAIFVLNANAGHDWFALRIRC